MIWNHQSAHDMFRVETPLVSPKEERSLRDDIRDMVRNSGLADILREFSWKPTTYSAQKTESTGRPSVTE